MICFWHFGQLHMILTKLCQLNASPLNAPICPIESVLGAIGIFRFKRPTIWRSFAFNLNTHTVERLIGLAWKMRISSHPIHLSSRQKGLKEKSDQRGLALKHFIIELFPDFANSLPRVAHYSSHPNCSIWWPDLRALSKTMFFPKRLLNLDFKPEK